MRDIHFVFSSQIDIEIVGVCTIDVTDIPEGGTPEKENDEKENKDKHQRWLHWKNKSSNRIAGLCGERTVCIQGPRGRFVTT